MDEGRFAVLPQPVRLEDTVTSQDVVSHDPPTVDLVDAWLLRTAAG